MEVIVKYFWIMSNNQKALQKCTVLTAKKIEILVE